MNRDRAVNMEMHVEHHLFRRVVMSKGLLPNQNYLNLLWGVYAPCRRVVMMRLGLGGGSGAVGATGANCHPCHWQRIGGGSDKLPP